VDTFAPSTDLVSPGPEPDLPGEAEPEVDPELVERAAVDAQCLALHRTGATYRDIATRLNVSTGRAHRGCVRAREAEPHLDPEGVRADLSASLDRSMLELSAMIADRTTPQDRKIRATLALVTVVDRKAKLHGADAPVRRQIDVTVLTQEALDAEQARLERELEAAGIDVSALPGVQDVAQLIEATARVVE